MSVHLSDTDSQSEELATLTSPEAAPARTVLDGAFSVLDALAHAEEGLGLTALARVSGLAKTSAHRLAEQLVALGAVVLEPAIKHVPGRTNIHAAPVLPSP